jgi:hypothetical protein
VTLFELAAGMPLLWEEQRRRFESAAGPSWESTINAGSETNKWGRMHFVA